MRSGLLFLLVCVHARAQSSTAPVLPSAADRAYAELRALNYDAAIGLFEQAIAAAPNLPHLRKDLAYTYLRVGEPALARGQFKAAWTLNANDEQAALEYAFLCFETRERREARLVFDQIRRRGNATAEAAFQNIDRELAAGLERWTKAAQQTPDRFSVHQELARLAEERDALDLAARHYREAWRLRPDMREFLLDLGRIQQLQGQPDAALIPLLAASRGPEPRIAERAKELLPARYPYPAEFEAALRLDGRNQTLRRELGFLHLAMDQAAKAEEVFERCVREDPADLLAAAQLGFLKLKKGDVEGARPLLERVLAGSDPDLIARVRAALKTVEKKPKPSDVDAKSLGIRSYDAGYLADALRYFKLALERDPKDAEVLLRLGWTLNVLKRDSEALRYFDQARQSGNPLVAVDAEKAWKRLRPDYAPFRTTIWAFPFYSTRWHSGFTYGQAKTEFRLGNQPFRPYLGVRFVGDLAGQRREGLPPLSERAAIPAVGVGARLKHGVYAFAEFGRSMSYSGERARTDIRAGVSYAKGWGRQLAGSSNGVFFTTNADAVFVSRFDRNTLFYSQNRGGYTWRGRLQLVWNANLTQDSRRFWWGNFWETGPGLRLKLGSATFSVDALRGRQLIQEGNPRGPEFTDLRMGVWYALTR